MERHRLINFLNFLLKRVYQSKPIPEAIIFKAFDDVVKDVQYHFPKTSSRDVLKRIESNQNELAVFLYRLGSQLHIKNREDLKFQIHFLMKDLCGCEIYFNTTIGEGFYIVHGQGTIIGSRNNIGKGFIIHQNCTIGHKVNGYGAGNKIGENVKVYCNSSIIGELTIGDNVIIGAHTMVNTDVRANCTVISSSRIKLL